jgi:hypothetical protein
MLSSLDVWISSADDWKHNNKGNYNDGDDDDDDDPKGYRNKRSYKKIRFPVKRVKNYRKFPISKFSIISYLIKKLFCCFLNRTFSTIDFNFSMGTHFL